MSPETTKVNEKINDSKKTFFKNRFIINRELLPLKFHYFIYFAALACVLPFRTIFAKQLGVSGTEIGIVFAVVPLVKVFTNPICGAIMDRFKKFRLILYILMILVAGSHLALTFIPHQQEKSGINSNVTNHTLQFFNSSDVEYEELRFRRNLPRKKDEQKNLECDIRCDHIAPFKLRNLSYMQCTWFSEKDHHKCGVITTETITFKDEEIFLRNCDDVLALSIGTPNNSDLAAASMSSCLDNVSFTCISEVCSLTVIEFSENQTTNREIAPPFTSLQFWLFLLLMLVSNSTFCAVIFLIDGVCYEILDNKPEKFGEQRLWGSIGWGTGSLLAGYFNQLFTGDSKTVDYAPCFYLLTLLIMIDLIPLHYVRVDNVKFSKNIMQDVLRLVRLPEFIVYSAVIFCIGIISGLIWNYEFWFLEELNASQMLLGLTQTVQCFFSEVPCFFVGGWVCKKIGYNHCNSIAFLFFFLRYAVYVPMQNPWLSLPAGLLQGPTFGLFFAAMTAFAKQKALPGTEATIQGLLAVIFEATGVATGSILGGISIDGVGSRKTFLYASVFSLSMLVINIFLTWIMKGSTDEGKSKKCDDNSKDVVNLENFSTKL